MVERLEDLAWDLLRDASRRVDEPTEYLDQRAQIEAARLSALNEAYSVWNEGERYCEIPLVFNKLSYRSQIAGLSRSDVDATPADRPPQSLSERVASLNRDSFVNLLTHIHSLGCYRLPLNLDFSAFRRSLGAYYTPRSMAKFITSRTLGPKVERAAKTRALPSLIKFLRILDPACGTGVFLVSAYKHLRSALEDVGEDLTDSSSLNKAIVHSLCGVDLDEGALEVARVSILLTSGIRLRDASILQEQSNMRQGNSLISLLGIGNDSDHGEYFDNPETRMPLEWREEFGNVFERSVSGFDCILMNPPYERLKPNLAEFLRERLVSGNKTIHMKRFEDHRKRLAEDVNYFRNSGEYSYSNRFTLNTYQLFIERSLQLARKGGVVGCIVPSTLLGDQSTERLRRELLQRNRIHSVHEFPESSRIFEGVTQSVLVLVVSKGGTTRELTMSYGLRGVEEAMRKEPMRISTDRLLPCKVIPRLSRGGWDIVTSIQAFPPLSEITGADVRRGELDLTLNKSCILDSDNRYPLVRGSNISRFRLLGMDRSQFVDVGMLKEQLGESKRVAHLETFRIATQQVSNMNQRWRLKSSFVPPSHVLANSCNYIVLAEDVFGSSSLWYLMGVLNSELVNWRFNVGSFNNHISIRELRSLPIVVPSHPEQKKMRNLIVRETRRVFKDNQRPTNLLNAMVFRIYGLDTKMAEHVLETRDTPKEEAESILGALRDFV